MFCRPLSQEALEYAATDVHYLLHIAALQARLLHQPLPPAATAHAASPAAGPGPAKRSAPQPVEANAGAAGPSSDAGHRIGPVVSGNDRQPDNMHGISSEARGMAGKAGWGEGPPSAALQQASERSQRVTMRLYSKIGHEAAAVAAAQSVLRRCGGSAAPVPADAAAVARASAAEARQAARATRHSAASAVPGLESGSLPGASGNGADGAAASSAAALPATDGSGGPPACDAEAPGDGAVGRDAQQPSASGRDAGGDRTGGGPRVGAAAQDCIYALCTFRDQLARELDEGGFLLIIPRMPRDHPSVSRSRSTSASPLQSCVAVCECHAERLRPGTCQDSAGSACCDYRNCTSTRCGCPNWDIRVRTHEDLLAHSVGEAPQLTALLIFRTQACST